MKTVRALTTVMIAVLIVIAVALVALMGLGIAGVLPKMNVGLTQGELVNEQAWSADEVSQLAVAYNSESIRLLPSEDGRVMLREYMTGYETGMEATTALSGGSLSIRAGERPILSFGLLGGWTAHIELYVPTEWLADVRLETSSGSIRTEDDFDFKSFAAKASSGSVRLAGITARGDISLQASSGSISANALAAGGDVQLSASSGSVKPGAVTAASISAEANSGSVQFDSAIAARVTARTTSGSLRFGTLEGEFALKNSSGGVQVDGGAGFGSVETTSGSVRVTLDALRGDVTMTSSSGSCRLTLPQGSSFNLVATTGSGSIHTPDGGSLSYDRGGNVTGGGYGGDPQYTVTMKATSGSVRVEFD